MMAHPEVHSLGRALVIIGGLIIVVGLVLMLGAKVPGLGRLPGDIAIRRDGFSFYFPLTSCLLASLIMSVVLWLVNRFRP